MKNLFKNSLGKYGWVLAGFFFFQACVFHHLDEKDTKFKIDNRLSVAVDGFLIMPLSQKDDEHWEGLYQDIQISSGEVSKWIHSEFYDSLRVGLLIQRVLDSDGSNGSDGLDTSFFNIFVKRNKSGLFQLEEKPEGKQLIKIR